MENGDKQTKSRQITKSPPIERLLDECYTILLCIDRLSDDYSGDRDPAGADGRIHHAARSLEVSFSVLCDLEIEISGLTPTETLKEFLSICSKAKSLTQRLEVVLDSLLDEAQSPKAKVFSLLQNIFNPLRDTYHNQPRNRLLRLQEKGEALTRRAKFFLKQNEKSSD